MVNGADWILLSMTGCVMYCLTMVVWGDGVRICCRNFRILISQRRARRAGCFVGPVFNSRSRRRDLCVRRRTRSVRRWLVDAEQRKNYSNDRSYEPLHMKVLLHTPEWRTRRCRGQRRHARGSLELPISDVGHLGRGRRPASSAARRGSSASSAQSSPVQCAVVRIDSFVRLGTLPVDDGEMRDCFLVGMAISASRGHASRRAEIRR